MAVSLSLSITQNSQNQANNTTSVTVKATATWSYGSWNATGRCTGTITIDGTKYSFSGIKFNTGQTTYGSQVVMTKTVNVTHNADGSKALACSASFVTGVSSGTISASASKTLTKIPRQATITAAPDFTDEENPTITYSNPAGDIVDRLRACISFTGATADIAYREISKTGNSYTFNLTDAEREVLRNGTTDANSRTVRFYVETLLGDQTLRNSVEKTLTIVNAAPKLTPTVKDGNAAIVALTGDSNILVKYYSNASASATYAGLKGASITSYSVASGGKTATTNPATFSAVENGEFTFSVEDSRGNVTTVPVSKPLVEYVKLSCTMGDGKPDAEGNMALRASGNFFNGSFGAVANTITVQYRHKVQGGEYGDWQAMTATASGNTYTAEADLTGLDYRVAHTFQVQAVDQVCSCASVERTVKTFPVFDWGENDFNFNVPVHFAQGATGLEFETDEVLPIEKGGTGATTAADALANLGGATIEKLWVNANPSASFGEQTVALDLSGYSAVLIYFSIYNGSATYAAYDTSMITKVGESGYVCCMGETGAHPTNRGYTVNTTGVSFKQAYYIKAIGGSLNWSTNIMRPIEIYGIKGVITE